LEPVKKSEDTWLKILFPEEDPSLSPNHPGAAPLVKELSSPYGEIGDDKDGQHIQDGADHPDYKGWQCYYLPKKCRKNAQHRTEELMEETRAKVVRQERDFKEFKNALSTNPVKQWQGSGTVASADYWAKTSTPVMEKTHTGIIAKVPGRKPATLSHPDSDPRIREWYAQCEHLPELLPVAAQNLRTWSNPQFKFGLQMGGSRAKTYIHQPSGRWLECLGGYSGSNTSPNPFAAQATSIVQTPPLTDQFKCRPLHEEPLENCSHCPRGGAEPSEYRCLGKGWNAIPKGEFTSVRSILRPVSPAERPDEKEAGSSGALLAARESVTPKNLSKRSKPGIGDLQCIHIGRPGNIQTNSADRVIYAASEMPAPALIAAAMAPDFGQPKQLSQAKLQHMRQLDWFL